MCKSDSNGTKKTHTGSGLGMPEIGYNTGLFGAAVSLTGPDYKRLVSESGKYQYGSSNGGDSKGKYGSWTLCKLTASNTGGFSINWEYSEDQHISVSGKYGYREGDVSLDKMSMELMIKSKSL